MENIITEVDNIVDYENGKDYSECQDNYNQYVHLNEINIEGIKQEVDYFESFDSEGRNVKVKEEPNIIDDEENIKVKEELNIIDDEENVKVKEEPNIIEDKENVKVKEEPNIIDEEENVKIKEEDILIDGRTFLNTEINKYNGISSDTNVKDDQPKNYIESNESLKIELVPVYIPRKKHESYSVKNEKICMPDDDDISTNESIIHQDNVNNIDIHSNDKNFSKTNHVLKYKNKHTCDICNKKFTQSCKLKNHVMSIHLGIKQYKCEICDQKFTQESTLNTHITRTHIEEYNNVYVFQI